MVGYSYNITWRGDRDCSSLAMHSCTWVRDRHRLNRPGNGLHGQYGCVLVQYCCNCGIRRRRHKVSSWLILSENQTPWYPNPNYHCREAQYLALFPSQPLSNVNIDKVVRTRYMFQVLQTMQLGPEQFHAVHVRGVYSSTTEVTFPTHCLPHLNLTLSLNHTATAPSSGNRKQTARHSEFSTWKFFN